LPSFPVLLNYHAYPLHQVLTATLPTHRWQAILGMIEELLPCFDAENLLLAMHRLGALTKNDSVEKARKLLPCWLAEA
jgi:hypothetical protein